MAEAGWRYLFPAPTLTTAIRAPTACRKGVADAYRLPWCATLRTVDRSVAPDASNQVSVGASASPANSTENPR